MKLKITQEEYDDWKDKQRGHDDPMADAYGLACFSYAERWAHLMEAELEVNPDLDFGEMAKRTSHEADVEGITGFMYGASVSILANCWTEGETLRRWHNLKAQLGNEGEKANEEGGVLNPATIILREE